MDRIWSTTCKKPQLSRRNGRQPRADNFSLLCHLIQWPSWRQVQWCELRPNWKTWRYLCFLAERHSKRRWGTGKENTWHCLVKETILTWNGWWLHWCSYHCTDFATACRDSCRLAATTIIFWLVMNFRLKNSSSMLPSKVEANAKKKFRVTCKR